MQVALIADIHGNVPALDAVLGELGRNGADRVLCLGDVGYGPQPGETLERLEALGCPVIMGNWDASFLGRTPSLDGELESILLALGAWSKEQLSKEHLDYVRSFRESVEVPLGDGAALLAFHGSPRSYEDAILATTPDEELDRMFDGRRATVFASAHTHFQLFRRFEESVVVNPGSVGLPFRRQTEGVMRIAPWAEYGVVLYEQGRLAVELRRTAYDVDRLIRIIRESGMPNAEWWADLWKPERQAVG
jgi:predicted phosphodiesterase